MIKNIFIIQFFLLLSLQVFGGLGSLTIFAKLVSIEGNVARVEYKRKKFRVPLEKIENLKSAIPGEEVKLLILPGEFDFIEKQSEKI